MEYKLNNIVKIKTWEDMEKEYGLVGRSIHCNEYFTPDMERDLKEYFPDRILTIGYKDSHFYKMLELYNWQWSDDMIECLAEKEIIEPIFSRFEILDL